MRSENRTRGLNTKSAINLRNQTIRRENKDATINNTRQIIQICKGGQWKICCRPKSLTNCIPFSIGTMEQTNVESPTIDQIDRANINELEELWEYENEKLKKFIELVKREPDEENIVMFQREIDLTRIKLEKIQKRIANFSLDKQNAINEELITELKESFQQQSDKYKEQVQILMEENRNLRSLIEVNLRKDQEQMDQEKSADRRGFQFDSGNHNMKLKQETQHLNPRIFDEIFKYTLTNYNETELREFQQQIQSEIQSLANKPTNSQTKSESDKLAYLYEVKSEIAIELITRETIRERELLNKTRLNAPSPVTIINNIEGKTITTKSTRDHATDLIADFTFAGDKRGQTYLTRTRSEFEVRGMKSGLAAIPTFKGFADGNKTIAEVANEWKIFLNKLRCVANLEHWGRTEVSICLELKLAVEASTRLMNAVGSYASDPEKAIAFLQRSYGTTLTPTLALKACSDIKQGVKESINDYAARALNLIGRARNMNMEMAPALNGFWGISTFIDGILDPSLRRTLYNATKDKDTTLDEMIERARELEKKVSPQMFSDASRERPLEHNMFHVQTDFEWNDYPMIDVDTSDQDNSFDHSMEYIPHREEEYQEY